MPLEEDQAACVACGRTAARTTLHPFAAVWSVVSAMIARHHPKWRAGAHVCTDDLDAYRRRAVEALLKERGEVGDLEREVIDSVATGQTISQIPQAVVDENATFGDRMADRVAALGGSWAFILSFCAILALWMTFNVTGLLFEPFDRYPFILLNLVLSTLAALQAPVIMMSQRRKEAKDRLRAENDYQVNLKAELEIRQLAERLDHHLALQSEHVARLQLLQMELIEERRRPSADASSEP